MLHRHSREGAEGRDARRSRWGDCVRDSVGYGGPRARPRFYICIVLFQLCGAKETRERTHRRLLLKQISTHIRPCVTTARASASRKVACPRRSGCVANSARVSSAGFCEVYIGYAPVNARTEEDEADADLGNVQRHAEPSILRHANVLANLRNIARLRGRLGHRDTVGERKTRTSGSPHRSTPTTRRPSRFRSMASPTTSAKSAPRMGRSSETMSDARSGGYLSTSSSTASRYSRRMRCGVTRGPVRSSR